MIEISIRRHELIRHRIIWRQGNVFLSFITAFLRGRQKNYQIIVSCPQKLFYHNLHIRKEQAQIENNYDKTLVSTLQVGLI